MTEEFDDVRVSPGEDLPAPIAPRLRQIADRLQAHTTLWLSEINQLRNLADELEAREHATDGPYGIMDPRD